MRGPVGGGGTGLDSVGRTHATQFFGDALGRPVGVEPAGVGQDPHGDSFDRVLGGLRTDTGPGPRERFPVGGDAEHGEQPGPVGPEFRGQGLPAACSSAAVSSSARAVARSTRLVTPKPRSRSRCCSAGRRRRGVSEAACKAGQNRLPGRAKWCPLQAEYSPGLIPQNRMVRPGPITSGTVVARAAASSAASGPRRGFRMGVLPPRLRSGRGFLRLGPAGRGCFPRPRPRPGARSAAAVRRACFAAAGTAGTRLRGRG